MVPSKCCTYDGNGTAAFSSVLSLHKIIWNSRKLKKVFMRCKSQCLIHTELRYLTYSVVSVSPQCYWDIIGALLVSAGQGYDTITDPVLSETNNPSLSSLQTIRSKAKFMLLWTAANPLTSAELYPLSKTGSPVHSGSLDEFQWKNCIHLSKILRSFSLDGYVFSCPV